MTDEDKKLLDEWRAVERELYKRIWFMVSNKSGTLMDLAMSALPSEADIRAGLQDVCFVPIVLQKSFCLTDHKFSGL